MQAAYKGTFVCSESHSQHLCTQLKSLPTLATLSLCLDVRMPNVDCALAQSSAKKRPSQHPATLLMKALYATSSLCPPHPPNM
jgi:hypothetical protein